MKAVVSSEYLAVLRFCIMRYFGEYVKTDGPLDCLWSGDDTETDFFRWFCEFDPEQAERLA